MDRYEAAIAAIYALRSNKWRHGLDRMEELASRLGVAKGGTPSYVHVTGTNGKGSTTTFVQAVLTAAGHQTGGYFSPYVFDLRERIQLNGCMVPVLDFCDHAEAVIKVCGELTETSFGAVSEFEAKTAMGFRFWNERSCRFVALEAGLGGPLDSTNIVDPAVSVITSVGLDHVGVLGSTVEEIAQQKAGIIKPGRPVVTGRLGKVAAETVAAKAQETGSELFRLGEEFDWMLADHDEWVFRLGETETILPRPTMRGQIQLDNASIALAACRLADPDLQIPAIETGIRQAAVPGRFQIARTRGQAWVLDGAHNVDSARNLAIELEREYPDQRHDLIYGALEGHDYRAVLQELAGSIKTLHVVAMAWHRSLPADEIAQTAREMGIEAITHGSCEEAVHFASGDTVVVTGSFYLLADVVRAGGLDVQGVPELGPNGPNSSQTG